MKIADIEQQLIQAGCKSVHIDRFWRNWYSGKPLNRSKVRLPAAAEALLPQLEEFLTHQLMAQEKPNPRPVRAGFSKPPTAS